MKFTRRDLTVLLYLVAIISMLLCYNFVYSPKAQEAETILGECTTLQDTVTDLKSKVEKQPTLEKEISDMTAEIEEIRALYPTAITEQNLIMYVKELNEKLDMNITNMSFSSATPIYTIVGTGKAEKYQLTAESIELAVDYKTDYEGFKKIMDYINQDEDHRTINSVALSIDPKTPEQLEDSFDEDGNVVKADSDTISGTINMTLYIVHDNKASEGEAEENERFEVPTAADHGVNDIFNTVREQLDEK